MTETFYVACAENDRLRPVIEDTFEECIESAVESFNLRYSLRDPSSWDLKTNIDGPRHWRAKANAPYWDHVSVHEVELDD